MQDLELLAEAEQVLGRGDRAIQTLRRAYRARIEAGEVDQAITSAFWLWQALIINAEFARANGWVAQVRRLADERPADEGPADEDSPTSIDGNGWLLVTDAYSLVAAADYDRAFHLLACAAEVASRHGQTDLVAFATTLWVGRWSRPDGSRKASADSTRRWRRSSIATPRRGRPACSIAARSPPVTRFESSPGPGSGRSRWARGSIRSPYSTVPTSATAGSTGLI